MIGAGHILAAWRFESPGYLALLALLPLLVALSYRSLAGLGPVRRVAAIALRCLVVTVIVLALAGAQQTRRIEDLSVIFLVDRSKSIPPDLQRAALDYLKKAETGRPRDDRVAVVGFAGSVAVDQLPMRKLAVDQVSAPGNTDATNLAAAARMAAALLPADTIGRIVLLTDGNENVGDVRQEAERLRAAGIPIDVVPLTYELPAEVVFESLKAPPTASADETINLNMVLRAQQACTGRILLWQNDQLVNLGAAGRVTLSAGPNMLTLPIPLRVARVHRFRAQFVPDDGRADAIAENNAGETFTVVSGQGEILILTTQADLGTAQPSAYILRDALEAERLPCTVEVAGEKVLDQVRLLDCALVILNNVPANEVSEDEKKTLAVYVRELGGGLVMLGGDESFGAGGWLGSEIEEVMPVSFDVKHKKQFIKGALVLVMHASEAPNGNYLGERCAIEAVKTLSARDLVGVLAWKNLGGEQGNWVVPLQEVGGRTPIINAIRQMSMGDLPYLDDVMRPGVEALLKRSDVGPKHMIVISDFDPQAPRDDLLARMKRAGITCSTVAIGYGSHFINENLARTIAETTGGRFYSTQNFSQLPQIFIKESREVRRSLVQEGQFRPALANPLSPVLPGVSGAGLPPLNGYVVTTAKPLADIPIVRKAEEGTDPILAHWQVGLGKTVAFTSGLWPRWGPSWTSWDKFSKFWAQVARWASRQSASADFDVATSVHGGKGRVRVDALDQNAEALNFLDLSGEVLLPDQTTRPLRLVQTAPGRYEAEFDARERGNYIVRLPYTTGPGATSRGGTLWAGVSVAYSPEYAQMQPNLAMLEEIRDRTGGRELGAEQAPQVFDRAGLKRNEARAALWETLARWMLVLFLIDVAVRRIAISPAELARKARRFLAEMAGRGRTAEEAAAVLTTLKGTRGRVREEQERARAEQQQQVREGRAAGAAGEDAADRAGTRFEASRSDRATEDLSRALGGATQQDAPVVARPTGKKPAVSEGEYTSRLLRAKKRAREEMDKPGEPPAG